MKVLDLACANSHCFEGWFDSEDDFQGQLARGLLECPVCGDGAITKRLSAPRLNLGAAPTQAAAADTATAVAGESESKQPLALPALDPALQAAWFKAMRRLVNDTENVGTRFAEEARRIHYGEAAMRSIRGQASQRETEQLLDEGIAVLPLPPALESTEH